MTDTQNWRVWEHYAAVIGEMPATFDSHAFIVALARRQQAAYIEALYACRGAVDPFKTAHAILAMHLKDHGGLVRQVGETRSANIFGVQSACAAWEKV